MELRSLTAVFSAPGTVPALSKCFIIGVGKWMEENCRTLNTNIKIPKAAR